MIRTFNRSWFAFIAFVFLSENSGYSGCFQVQQQLRIQEQIQSGERFAIEAELLQWQGQSIPVPLGVNSEAFGAFLSNFASLPRALEAFMIFGSRTHFTDGYLPTPGSDLDIHAFVSRGDHGPELRAQIEGLRKQLRDSALLSVEDNLTWTESLLTIMNNTRAFTYHKNFAQEQRFYADVRKKLSSSGLRGMTSYERSFMRDMMEENSGVFIGKEALLFLRKDSALDDLVDRLLRLDYSHVYRF